MIYFYGQGRYGKIDHIPGDRHVVTMFFHFNFVPLIPLYTLEVSEHPDTYDQARKIDFSWRSVFTAWGNCLYFMSILWLAIVGLMLGAVIAGGHINKPETAFIFVFALLNAGLVVGLHYGLSWLKSIDRASTRKTAQRKRRPAPRVQESMTVTCPECESETVVDRDFTGRKVRCSFCSTPISVPRSTRATRDTESIHHDDQFAGSLLKAIAIVIGISTALTILVGVAIIFGGQLKQPAPQQAAEQKIAFQRPDFAPMRPQLPDPPPQMTPPLPPNIPTPALPTSPTNDPMPGPPDPFPGAGGPSVPNPPRFNPRMARPPVPPPIFPMAGPADATAKRSELAGGSGGAPFVRGLNGNPMIGVDYRFGSWAGRSAIGIIFPVAVAGPPKPGCQQVVAPAGYAVGGINVCAPQFVTQLQLIYMKQRPDGSLDPADTKLSEWLGGAPQGDVKTISGDGKRIVGLHGKGAAVLDAIGILIQ